MSEYCAATNSGKTCIQFADHRDDHADDTGATWHNHGPVQRYEVTWMSGHIETVLAHQVTYPHAGLAMLGMGGMLAGSRESGPPRVQMHAEIDSRWVLTLSAREEDIRTMRLVTEGEPIPGGGS